MASDVTNRETVRDAFTTLLSTALVGSGLPVQAVYGYKIGDFQGQSPIVIVGLQVLSAVIEGLPPWPGLFERWELYAPWLDEEWVCSVRFEDDRKETAERVLSCGFERALEYAELGYDGPPKLEHGIFDAAVNEMVNASGWTQLSPTFREGKSGGWVEHFKEEHKDLFKKLDTENWLVKLGYAENEDW